MVRYLWPGKESNMPHAYTGAGALARPIVRLLMPLFLMDSRPANPRSCNLTDRDYFRAHSSDDSVGTYIGGPTQGRTTGEWFVGISRRLSGPEGSFAGVVMGSLRLSYFEQMFNDIAL